MHILLLGARAPICLELARAFKASGHTVTVADSVRFPLTRFSNAAEHFVHLPAPRYQLTAWTEQLAAYIQKSAIDWVIPTCEEAFYLSAQKMVLPARATVFVADFRLLHALHDKAQFAALTASWPISAPRTVLVDDQSTLSALLAERPNSVVKPVFSRFASATLIKPTVDALPKISIDAQSPWVIQDFIDGEEFCSYGVFHQGQLVAHSCYRPLYRAGKGAGLYFDPVTCAEIEAFAQYFAQQTHYSGQAGFDFIRDATGKLWVLECNPRGSSGLHLFKHQSQALTEAFIAPQLQKQILRPMVNLPPLTFKVAMIMTSLLNNLHRRPMWLADYRRAQTIIPSAKDPLPSIGQWLSSVEMGLIAIRMRRSLWSATTADIEWNGQALKHQH